MREIFINAFYPAVCPICKSVLKGNRKICEECEKKVLIIREPKCQKCGKPLVTEENFYCRDCIRKQHVFDKGVSIFKYQGELKESIYRFKYGNAREYAEYYAGVATGVYGRILKQWNIEAIVPVPVHKKREIKRGYNQAGVFGQALAEYTGIPLEKKLLLRVKNTPPQKNLTDTMRYLNLKNAFIVNKDRMNGIKNVLLTDDIYTTGSTADACSTVLKQAGVEKVYVMCISAGV